MSNKRCDCGCGKTFPEGSRGKRYFNDACKARHHRRQHMPGKVKGVRELAKGGVSVTVHFDKHPGIHMGAQVRLETAPKSGSDGS